jgi:arylsulfatase A-like enzyme
VDLPVTLLDAADTTFKGSVDGRSLLDLALEERLGADTEAWRQEVVCETHGHHREPVVGRALITQRYKYVAYKFHRIPDYLVHLNPPKQTSELYDLKQDPYQLCNLVDDPEYQDVVADLRRRLEAWRERTDDPVSL